MPSGQVGVWVSACGFHPFHLSIARVVDEGDENLISPLLNEDEIDVAKKVPQHCHRRINVTTWCNHCYCVNIITTTTCRLCVAHALADKI